jgi:hypothetical protein
MIGTGIKIHAIKGTHKQIGGLWFGCGRDGWGLRGLRLFVALDRTITREIKVRTTVRTGESVRSSGLPAAIAKSPAVTVRERSS